MASKHAAAAPVAGKPDTRKKLMRSALRLFVEKGYHRTTTDQISRAAGVSAGALYVHFRSKEDLALTLFKQLTEDAAEGVPEAVDGARNTEERIRALTAHLFEWCEAHREEAIFLILLRHAEIFTTRPEITGSRHNLARLLDEAIARGQQDGEIPQTDPRLLRKVSGILIVFVRDRLEGWYDGDLRDDIEAAACMCCAALRAPVGNEASPGSSPAS